METEHTRFAELLTQHIQDTVQRKFSDKHLTPAVMREIRQTIKQIVSNVFQRSNHKLSDIAQAWLTDQVFKRVQVNQDVMMENLIVIHEYKLSQLTYDDVRLLRDLFNQTDLAQELTTELTKRSMS